MVEGLNWAFSFMAGFTTLRLWSSTYWLQWTLDQAFNHINSFWQKYRDEYHLSKTFPVHVQRWKFLETLYKVQSKTQKLLNRGTTDFRWTRISLLLSSNFLSLICQQNQGDVNQTTRTLFHNKQKEPFHITDVALTHAFIHFLCHFLSIPCPVGYF